MRRRISLAQRKRLLKDYALERDDKFPDRWTRLEKKLLAFGGATVLLQEKEIFAARLLKRGRLFNQRVVLRPGEPHQCHANAADLWAQDVARFQVVTGYVLHRKKWFAHSWVLDGEVLIESGGRIDRYFGLPLNPIEAVEFWHANVGCHLDYSQLTREFWVARAGLATLMYEALVSICDHGTLPMLSSESPLTS